MMSAQTKPKNIKYVYDKIYKMSQKKHQKTSKIFFNDEKKTEKQKKLMYLS